MLGTFVEVFFHAKLLKAYFSFYWFSKFLYPFSSLWLYLNSFNNNIVQQWLT